MKNYLFKVILVFVLFFTVFTPLSISEAATSYKMNPKKIYTYKSYETDIDGKKINQETYKTAKFIKKVKSGDIWSYSLGKTYKKEVYKELWKEDSKGLQYKDDYGKSNYPWEQELIYPIKKGAEWNKGLDIFPTTIISVNKTVKTPAGTFKNCVVVDFDYKILTFAKGVGLVKIETRSRFTTELQSIKNK